MKNLQKQTLATEINNRANAMNGPESLGYKRYSALTRNMSYNLMLAHYFRGEPDNAFVKTVASFFSGMTENEYKLWIINNA